MAPRGATPTQLIADLFHILGVPRTPIRQRHVRVAREEFEQKRMSLRKNILANYLGQGWTGLIGVVLVPLYIKILGIEAYGLIGIFAILQSAMGLLDLGMTPTLNREMARFLAGARTAESTRDLLRSLELIYIGIGAVIVTMIWFTAPWLATHWLQVQNLPLDVVGQTLLIMSFVVAARAWEQAYRGAIQGMQRQVWLNVMQSALATLRWVGVLGVLYWISPTIYAFFVWQGLVSLLTVMIYGLQTYRWLPTIPRPARFSIETLKGVGHFTITVAATTLVSLVLTQIDKILLSKLFSLEVFGYYTLAATAASALAPFVYPMGSALYPRLSEQVARGDMTGAAATYQKACQWLAALIIPSAVMLAAFARTALFVWTGDPALAVQVAPIVRLLVLGNLCNGLMIPAYMLQLANGWPGLAVKVNIVAICFIVPGIILVVPQYGAVGAAAIWLILNAGYLLFAIPWMHTRLLPNQMWRWYRDSLVLPLAFAALTAGILLLLVPERLGRIEAIAALVASGGLVMGMVALSIPTTRAVFAQQIKIFRERLAPA